MSETTTTPDLTMHDLLLGFYGDDFTGSTDAMDALARTGIETVLFLSPPDESELNDLEDAQAVGIAGTSRSMTPSEMTAELGPAFDALSATGASLVHYKICSTFDSSPTVGSIGKAIDVGTEAFDASVVPLVPGAPPLGRYVLFGNMFAEHDGEIYRLDRHPTMSDHPVTPMDESDLLRHLSRQTDSEMDLVDVRRLRDDPAAAFREKRAGTDVVVFDALDRSDLNRVGRVLWEEHADPAGPDRAPEFVVGSSGVEYALASHWEDSGLVGGPADFDDLAPVERTVVVSGSASPVTDRQIAAAADHGFEEIRLETERLVRPDEREDERRRVLTDAGRVLERGRSVVVYTARGPDDPAIERTRAAAREAGDVPDNPGNRIGEIQGEVLAELVSEYDLERVCIAGGDTCGHATPKLGIAAVRTRYPLAPGSPVCDSLDDDLDGLGLQVALKGGQLGGPEYFVRILRGSEHPADRGE